MIMMALITAASLSCCCFLCTSGSAASSSSSSTCGGRRTATSTSTTLGWILFAFFLTAVLLGQDLEQQQGYYGQRNRGGGVLLVFAKDTETLPTSTMWKQDDVASTVGASATAATVVVTAATTDGTTDSDHPHHAYLRASSKFFTATQDKHHEQSLQGHSEQVVLTETGTSMVSTSSSLHRFMARTTESNSCSITGNVQCKMDRGIELLAHILKGVFRLSNGDDAFEVSSAVYWTLSSANQCEIDAALNYTMDKSLESSVEKMLDTFTNTTSYEVIKQIIQEKSLDFEQFTFLKNVYKEYAPIAHRKAKNRLTSYMESTEPPNLASFQASIESCFDSVIWECVDSSTFYYDDEVQHISRRCDQIAKLDSSYRLKLCKIQQISDNCPFVCGKCCEDDPTFQYENVEDKGIIPCPQFSLNNCTDLGIDGMMVGNHYCPKTCDSCFSQYLGREEIKVETTLSYDTLSMEDWSQENVEWEVSLISRYTKMIFEFPPNKCFLGIEEKENIESKLSTVSPGWLLELSAGEQKLLVPSVKSLLPSDCIAATKIKIVFPRSVYTLCIGGQCNPILCPIVAKSSAKCISQMLNFVPANTKVLFGENNNCSIIEPENWKEWVNDHFSYVEPNQRYDPSFYFADVDDDCVSNILEHYGLDLTKLYVDSFGPAEDSNIAQSSMVSSEKSTNPNKADSDGDRLTDGYELLFGSPPNVNHDSTQDFDSDGMTNFQEMDKLNSSLYREDSDVDGFSDNDEMLAGTDAMDARSVPPSNSEKQLKVEIAVTIGDESGSNSERWMIHVGDHDIMSPYYGILTTQTLLFEEGDYKITVEHIDSRLPTPDYDYTALIEFEEDDNFHISIIDDFKLLTRHIGMGASIDPTIGRNATLQIRRKGLAEDCLALNCASCNEKVNCQWDQKFRFCRPFDQSSPFRKDTRNDCACEKCKSWINDNRDVSWIDNLPLCPCTVEEFLSGSFSWLGLSDKQKGQYDGIDWATDMACNPNWGCDQQPQAKGCILSTKLDSHTGGQHCCYDTKLNLIEHGSKSAGNPHKSHYSLVEEHWLDDLRPYHFCCSDCEMDGQCEEYTGKPNGKQGVRSDKRECLSSP